MDPPAELLAILARQRAFPRHGLIELALLAATADGAPDAARAATLAKSLAPLAREMLPDGFAVQDAVSVIARDFPRDQDVVGRAIALAQTVTAGPLRRALFQLAAVFAARDGGHTSAARAFLDALAEALELPDAIADALAVEALRVPL